MNARTGAANQARQTATQAKLNAITETLQHMERDGTKITYPAVARRALVSRTFLYQNSDARQLMAAALATSADGARQRQASAHAQAEASWQQRALNAEDALKTAHAESGTQRERLGLLLGQLRDLEQTDTEETVQRVATENTALKQRVRQLSQDKRALEDKLQAVRSNNRFLDKRIADLEAQLLETRAIPQP